MLRLDKVLAEGEVGQYVAESLFVDLTPLISLLLGKSFQPLEVHFSYAKPEYASRYERAFGCPVYFNQPFSEFHFDAALLTHQLAEADSSTAQTCEESCRKVLNQLDIGVDIISNICHLLLSTPGEFPKLDAIAHKLSIGTRTLRRRLKGLGTSYQKILDDVKKELAIEYLQTTTLSVQEISDSAGILRGDQLSACICEVGTTITLSVQKKNRSERGCKSAGNRHRQCRQHPLNLVSRKHA